MDVITAYLETMFSPYPQTPRLLEAKAELREMMEDAYSAAIAAGRSQNEAVGQVITEFGNLDELAPVLGISAEIGPAAQSGGAPGGRAPGGGGGARSQQSPAAAQPGVEDRRGSGEAAGFGPPPAQAQAAPVPPPRRPAAPASPPVRLDEARAYADAQRRTQPMLAVAVVLFVLSPAALIGLAVLGDNPAFPVSSNVGAFIGIAVLLVLVLIGVGIMVRISARLEPHRRLTEHRFTPSPEVTEWAERLRVEHAGKRSAALVIAIGLWVLSALPTIASGLFADLAGDWGDQLPGFGVPATLVMVAIGLAVFLPPTWADTVADTLQSGTADERDEEEASYPVSVRVMIGILWPAAFAIFLAWSFIGNAWSISWIVWPIAGVTYWALTEVGSAARRER